MNDEERELLGALQIALLGVITPKIRAIGARTTANHHHFTVYVDGPISEDDEEDMAIVNTELWAHYPGIGGHNVTHEVIRMDAPHSIPKDQLFAYTRKES